MAVVPLLLADQLRDENGILPESSLSCCELGYPTGLVTDLKMTLLSHWTDLLWGCSGTYK